MSRRGFLQISALAASAGALAACGGGSSSSGSGSGNAFVFANWGDSFGPIYDQAIADYERLKSVKVAKQASVPYDDYQTRFRTLIAGGSPPDVMRLNDDFLREMADKKQILDLSGRIKSSGVSPGDYFQSAFDFPQRPNGHLGYTIGTSPRVIYYNKTLFEKAGVPLPPTTWTRENWEWDDFLAAAKATTKAPDVWGALLTYDGGFENIWSVNNGGPGIFSADGRTFTLADHEGAEAMQWVSDLATRHRVAPPWAEVQRDFDTAMRMFAAGKVAMVQGPFALVGNFRKSVSNFEWDVAPIPARVNQKQEGSIALFVIPSKAKNPDAAWDFLHYLGGEEGGRFFARNGVLVPVHRAAADELTADKKSPQHISLFAEAAEHHASINSTVATAQAQEIYRPQLERVYAGEMSAQEALNGVRGQIEALLAKGS